MYFRTAQEALAHADKLYSARWVLNDYWQATAENFYPERADFTVTRQLGDEFIDWLTTSYPVIARRDLANALTSMLRTDDWFQITVDREDLLDNESRQWLEWATKTQKRAMYDRATKFTRATKEGDHDFSTFGQCVISTELNQAGTKFLYKCHHLRDMAWIENWEGDIDFISKKWMPTAAQLKGRFPSTVHKSVADLADKEPSKTVPCYHMVMPTEAWGPAQKKWAQPFVSVYFDKDNNHVLEERGCWSMIYDIPRWQTCAGSQYAYSPATVCALPDARLIQAVTLTLLDAAERYARPPLLMVGEAIKSDVNLVPDGITVVDVEYDERTGDALRPLAQDKSGLPFGFQVRDDVREMIAEAFYLNKINMPPANVGREMTAFEVGQRVQEYIRQALPLFEPMEHEYNGAICESTFNLGMRNGLFGPPHMFPKKLQGQDVQFRFISPLTEAKDRKTSNAFVEGQQILKAAAEIDPTLVGMVDASTALRDTLTAVGVPTKWVRDQADFQKTQDQERQAQAMRAAMEQANQGAQVAHNVGAAAEQVNRAQQQAPAE